jgi:DnaA family protein
MSNQLSLNLQLRDDATLTSFYPGENQETLMAVTAFAKGEGEPFLYLWGQAGVGRSHLLQAVCHAATENSVSVLYIPLLTQNTIPSEFLQGIETLPLVCIDDVQKISGNALWEEAIFHLFNRIKMENGRLLVSANVPPTQLAINLPDLKSRLSWGVVYQIHPLRDEDKLQALQCRARYRGLQLDKTVGRFLLNRCPRNMVQLFHTLELLDKASLTEQRRLTIPFVKQVLGV